jgi:hydroxymethylglutaryl-CoA reductase (NADPH)
MNIRDYKTVNDRRNAVSKECGVDLKNIASSSIDDSIAGTRNCENMIGFTQVPVGIAGPLKVCHVSRVTCHEYYIPLSTTEGALVASVSRGCKAVTESGGAIAGSEKIGATRAPVFRVTSGKEGMKLHEFIKKDFNKLQQVAQSTSSHLTLKHFSSKGAGKLRFVRFVFDTQDAMGLNMVTIATDAMVSYIQEKSGAVCVSLSSNYCVDKKPAWINVVEGRGTNAWAEVTLTKKVLRGILKTTAQHMYDVWVSKCMVGSALSGSMAFNAQFANIVAAVFLATGQDIAHVVEGSLGITTAEVLGEDLYISVSLPDLMVGTVGGGTGLPTQKEALAILGISGGAQGFNSKKFAEIIAAAVLAGEISLLASLSEGTLAQSHARLARGKII